MNINHFKQMKQKNEKLTMVTCYDYCSAKIISGSQIDCILVGDSAAMVMHGYDSTLPATMDMMIVHVQAVCKGAPNKFIVGDMPFLSYRKSLSDTMDNVSKLMQAGANAIKLEGICGNEDAIQYIVNSGVPVIVHLGLTPQLMHQLGGFKVQGRERQAAQSLIKQAQLAESLGCFALVLECIPENVASAITKAVTIPTIGIGAGANVDGQVLVLQDLLGLTTDLQLKFVKKFIDGKSLFLDALDDYANSVKQGEFPALEHSFKEEVAC